MVLFENLLSKVEEANQRLGGMKKTKSYVDNAGEAKLHKALADGRERRKYYYGNLNTWRNSGSAAPSQQVIESINRMRKYINTYSMELNGLFLKLGLAPVSKPAPSLFQWLNLHYFVLLITHTHINSDKYATMYY